MKLCDDDPNNLYLFIHRIAKKDDKSVYSCLVPVAECPSLTTCIRVNRYHPKLQSSISNLLIPNIDSLHPDGQVYHIEQLLFPCIWETFYNDISSYYVHPDELAPILSLRFRLFQHASVELIK